MICRSLRGGAGIFSLIMLFLPFAIQDIGSLGRGFSGLPVFFVPVLFSFTMNPCGFGSCFTFRPSAGIICTDPRLHLFQYLLTGFQGYRIRFFAPFKNHSIARYVTCQSACTSCVRNCINNFYFVVTLYKFILRLIVRIFVHPGYCGTVFCRLVYSGIFL